MSTSRRPFVYPPPPPSSQNDSRSASRSRSPNSRSKSKSSNRSRSKNRKKSPAPPPKNKRKANINSSKQPKGDSPPPPKGSIPSKAPSSSKRRPKVAIASIPKPISPKPKNRNHNNDNHSIDNSNSGSNSSSIDSPKSLPFSPKFAGDETKDNRMATIDESQTQSKLHISDNDEYSHDSMYSDDDNHDNDDFDDDEEEESEYKRSPPQSPSFQNVDKAQQYRKFGPNIKLTTEHSARDVIRYSAMNQQRLSSKFGHVGGSSSGRIPTAAYANMARGGRDSVGTNFIMNGGLTMNKDDKGYNSDGSDDSVSMVSQSYGAYLFDANYKTKVGSTSLRARIGGLQLILIYTYYMDPCTMYILYTYIQELG